MDFGCGSSSAGGSGQDQGSEGSEGLKRKWSDLEGSMKAVKDAVVKENAEKSAKIRRLMLRESILEETLMNVQNLSRQQGPMTRPNPFAVFPAEVWEIIIERTNRSSDLEMLCLAFPQLEPLVKEKKKTIFLFENVMPLLCKHLQLKDINNCRLVCGKWNQVVCTLHANRRSPNLLSNATTNNEVTTKTPVLNRSSCYKLKKSYVFQTPGKIQQFLDKMADHPGNPFFGRFLRLYVDDGTNLELFWKSVLELVKKFGVHIWNLKFKCSQDNHRKKRIAEIDAYNGLQETLIYLPNLIYLKVDCCIPVPGLGSREADMEALIGRSPLPPLPYLQSFKLALNEETGMINAFSPFFSPQIRQLGLLKETLKNENLRVECLRGLINLENLKVELTSVVDTFLLLEFPFQNLKQLCLHSEYFHHRPPVALTSGEVESLLEKFSRVEYLDLTRYKVVPNSPSGTRMQFPMLKTLKIAVGLFEDDRHHNLDFLLWFPSLKHLIIQHMYSERIFGLKVDRHSTLKMRKYLDTKQMLKSNIWTLMPSLELIEHAGARKYTREMFEKQTG